MRARISVVIAVVCVALIASATFLPSTAQDRTEERLSDLETRVATLESLIGSTPSSPVSTSNEDETYVINGTFQLIGTANEDYAALSVVGCIGLGGYDDIQVGAQVRVTDAAGTLLGIGNLLPDEAAADRDECKFTFEVEVPESNFYTISAGSTRRGGATYSFEDLEQNDWIVELTLG